MRKQFTAVLAVMVILSAVFATPAVSAVSAAAPAPTSGIHDSLVQRLGAATQDSDRCRLSLQIAKVLIQEAPNSAIEFYQKALKLSQPHLTHNSRGNPFNAYYAEALRGMGNSCYFKGYYIAATGYYQQSLKWMTEIGDSNGIMKANNNLGLVYWKQGNPEKALSMYILAEEMASLKGNKEVSGAILTNIGLIQFEQGNYDKAVENYRKSLRISQDLNDQTEIANAFNNIGLVSWKTGNYDSAITCYQHALRIQKDLDDATGVAASYTNLGLVYSNKGDYSGALKYFQKALETIKKQVAPHQVALINGNLASTHLTLADSVNTQNSRIFHLEQAAKYGQTSFDIAKKIGAMPLVNAAAGDLQRAWTGLGDYRKALEYAEIYIGTRDSLYNEEKIRTLSELEVRYTAEKKQLEINRLLKEQAYQTEIIAHQEHENAIQRIILIITGIGILLVTIFSIWVAKLYFNKKKVNRLLEARRLEIEEKNLTKDKLFSIISHDLKNPFNVILGYCDILMQEARKLPEHAELKEVAATLQNASKQVSILLTNLLEWSMLQSGRLEPRPEPVNLGELAREVGLLCSASAGGKQIVMKTSIPATLCCYCDREMIKTVLRNLISNAVKFTHAGGQVIISAAENGGYARVSVEDTGIGLTREEIDGLFRLKQKITSKGTANEAGTGLGLIICREFVSANQGTITIDSEPGKGTCVSFTVPMAGNPCRPEKTDPRGIADARKGKILLVEDEDSNLYLLNRILTRENYAVVCASNGVEAVELLKQHPDVSLVLLDLQMPVMNGFDTIREIWHIRPGVPVIAQTGSSYPEDLRNIKAAGFTNWIFKPVEKEQLLKMVGLYLKANQS